MSYKLVGAVIILGSCGGAGFSIAFHNLREARLLYCLQNILQDMISDLTFQLTPLPDLVLRASGKSPELFQTLFAAFLSHLDRQVLPDVSSCMEAAIQDVDLQYSNLKIVLLVLGQSLGRFDLSGQLKGLMAVQDLCHEKLESLKKDQTVRLRGYRTLGICAGAALAILLI